MKYKTRVCFNYENWLIASVFISHIPRKSAVKMEHDALWADVA